MSADREVEESPFSQGADEEICYELTVTNWASTPTNVTVKLYQMPGYVDVSTTNLSGTAAVSGDVITLPIVKSLTANYEYRLEIKFLGDDGNIYECYAIIEAER